MTRHDPATNGPLEEVDGAALLHVLAFPKAKRNEIAGVRNGRLMVKVTAPPEDGKANAAIMKLLSRQLGIAQGLVELLSGGTSREKVFRFDGLEADAAKAALNL